MLTLLFGNWLITAMSGLFNCLKYRIWPNRSRKLQVVLVLLAGFSVGLLFGTLNTFGNLQPYVVSYIREKSHPSSLRYTQSTYLFSCQYAFVSLGYPVGGLLEKKLGIRFTVICAAVVTSSGLFLSYFSLSYSFWLLMLSYGAIFGLGLGIAYIATVLCVEQWLPNRAGAAIGFCTSGIGFSGLVFSSLQTGFINTSNESPNISPYDSNPDEKYFSQSNIIEKVPYIFLIQGVIFLIVLSATSLFLVNTNDYKTNKETPELSNQSNAKPLTLLTESNYYLQMTLTVLNAVTLGIISSQYKTYGIEELHVSDFFLTSLGIVSGIFSFFGLLLFGFLSDYTDYKFAYTIQSGVIAFLLSTLYITALGYPAMYFVWICGIQTVLGGYGTVANFTVLRTFGRKYFSYNFSVVFIPSQFVGGILAGVISYYCVDLFGWSGTFLLLGAFGVVQLISSLLLQEKHYTDKRYANSFLFTVLFFYNNTE